MKKLVIFTSVFLIIYFIFYFLIWKSGSENKNGVITEASPTPYLTNAPQASNFINVEIDGKSYLVYFSRLSDKKIEIIPNFSQKRSSLTIIEEAGCKAAINGGFYTKEGEPLGLFIVNGKTYSPEIISDKSLLTGYFYLDLSGKPFINNQKPLDSLFVIQSGPFIESNYKFSTTVDEETRRTVIVQTTQGIVYVLTIVGKDDLYSGPLLSDLPLLLFSITTPFKIEKALNMDGGSASAYYGEDGFSLGELSPVGSIICVKN